MASDFGEFFYAILPWDSVSEIFLYVMVYCFLALTTADNNEFYSNGWIPLSSDEIFNQIRRQFMQIPSYPTKDDVIKLVTPQIQLKSVEQVTEEVQFTKYEENVIKCKENDLSMCPAKNEENSFTSQDTNGFKPMFHIDTNANETIGKILRQAKKITDDNFKNEINLIFAQDKFKRNDNLADKNIQHPLLSKENIINKNPKNTYEVTENYKIEDLLNEEQSEIQTSGYNYDTPQLSNNNLTRVLFTILSNYNIKSTDKLPNYALSRSKNLQNSVKHDKTYQPFHWKTGHGYNSLNHLSVNPLLAVLLSNYGHYLPGWYGISSNYNNLYGYLASNNMHNNKPFGVYKIFSDTDSSI